LNSDNPYDAFILYPFSYEEFGKALIIKEGLKKKAGLPKGTGHSAHAEMARARDYLPSKCSHFTPWVKVSHPSDKTETVNYKVWRGDRSQNACNDSNQR
jgi:hypothetical protein